MQKIHHFNIWKSHYPINDSVLTQIYQLKEVDEGIPKTNKGGWHSKTFTPYKDYYNKRYQWTASIIEPLMEQVNIIWPQVKFSRAWFNMSHPGGNNRWHNHGTHPIVSVLYIKTPEPCSAIEFKQDNEVFTYIPVVGDFLIFPGTLEHRVLDNTSTEDRISLAVNFE